MHRHVLGLGFLGLLSIFILIGCRASVPRPLPPEEVLRRTVLTNATADSVTFRFDASLSSTTSSGSMTGTGYIVRAGRLWGFAGSAQFVKRSTDGLRKLFSRYTVVSPYPGTAFIRLGDLSGMMAETLPQEVLASTRQWTYLGLGTGSLAPGSHETIDPSAVESILQSLSIEQYGGMRKASDGIYEYHFELSTTSGALMPMSGSVDIDAARFQLRRVSWTHTPQSASDPSLKLTLLFFYTPHVSVPMQHEHSWTPFPLEAIWNTIFDSSLLPTEPVSGNT